MQTHFDGVSIGLDLCRELKEKGVEHFRIDGQGRTVEECQVMLADADSVGVDHLLIVSDYDVLEYLQNRNVEWMNEPNGKVELENYHHSFMVAYEICQKNGHRLHGPCISNTNQNSIDWLNEFMDMGVPQDFVVTYHTYRDDIRFEKPHGRFSGRGNPGEMRWIEAAAAGRSIACSEVGYDSIQEEVVAVNIKREFDLANEFNCLFCTYFQLNDDPLRDVNMGARRVDGSWKPVMECFSNS